jgi:cytochrome c553
MKKSLFHTLAALATLVLVSAAALPLQAAPPLLRSKDIRKKLPPPAPSVRNSRDASLIDIEQAVSGAAACVVDPARELFITAVSVVDDCFRTTWFGACPAPVLPATRGAWTFGKLAEGIFGTNNPAILHNEVLRWLNEWNFNRVVNGDLVPARPAVQNLVINPWLAASGGVQLDMRRAPFRLLAIVSRLDLRQPTTTAGAQTAGEGRFVFGLLDPNGNPTEYLLILEYGLDVTDCNGVLRWANQWHNLGTIPFGPNFNAALQKITDQFTLIGASPLKPNGSALNQARTDDFFLAAPWELREFTLQPPAGPPAPLLISTVGQTPANGHQNTALLANYANVNTPAIVANNYVVPLNWAAVPFRGGASTHALNFDWDGPPPACTSIANANARHILSLNTCNGCHGSETNTIFKHVQPRLAGAASALSGFLTGIGTVDMCGTPRPFNDLARRQVDLCNLVSSSCLQINNEEPVHFVH